MAVRIAERRSAPSGGGTWPMLMVGSSSAMGWSLSSVHCHDSQTIVAKIETPMTCGSVGPNVGVVLGCRLAAKGHPEEIQRIGAGGAEDAFLFEAAARGVHLEGKGEFYPADLR